MRILPLLLMASVLAAPDSDRGGAPAPPKPIDVACPRCGAMPGVDCDRMALSRSKIYHLGRVLALDALETTDAR